MNPSVFSSEKAIILEMNLFSTVCPDMILSAVEFLDEIIEERGIQ